LPDWLFTRMTSRYSRPLSRARPPGKRFAGCCRHYVLMLVAMLRSKGIAARARCGFGAYFTKDRFVDHWVTEYFDAAQGRWSTPRSTTGSVLCSA